jgi:hypothetical protein
LVPLSSFVHTSARDEPKQASFVGHGDCFSMPRLPHRVLLLQLWAIPTALPASLKLLCSLVASTVDHRCDMSLRIGEQPFVDRRQRPRRSGVFAPLRFQKRCAGFSLVQKRHSLQSKRGILSSPEEAFSPVQKRHSLQSRRGILSSPKEAFSPVQKRPLVQKRHSLQSKRGIHAYCSNSL